VIVTSGRPPAGRAECGHHSGWQSQWPRSELTHRIVGAATGSADRSPLGPAQWRRSVPGSWQWPGQQPRAGSDSSNNGTFTKSALTGSDSNVNKTYNLSLLSLSRRRPAWSPVLVATVATLSQAPEDGASVAEAAAARRALPPGLRLDHARRLERTDSPGPATLACGPPAGPR
jgi:hypothetical protein